jgi:hypothetical protein
MMSLCITMVVNFYKMETLLINITCHLIFLFVIKKRGSKFCPLGFYSHHFSVLFSEHIQFFWWWLVSALNIHHTRCLKWLLSPSTWASQRSRLELVTETIVWVDSSVLLDGHNPEILSHKLFPSIIPPRSKLRGVRSGECGGQVIRHLSRKFWSSQLCTWHAKGVGVGTPLCWNHTIVHTCRGVSSSIVEAFLQGNRHSALLWDYPVLHAVRLYRVFKAQADWTLTHTTHKDTEQSTIEASVTLDGIILTDSLIRWSLNELPSVCRGVPVSADKMFSTSNKPAQWTRYIFIYYFGPNVDTRSYGNEWWVAWGFLIAHTCRLCGLCTLLPENTAS